VALSLNTWANGTIAVAGEVHWYTFTAGTASTYHVQWDDMYGNGSAGGKTLPAFVSAYRADGPVVFTGAYSGYFSPQSVTMGAGETFSIKVEGQGGSTGTYAIQYYDPSSVPPQMYPNNIRVRGNPGPAIVVTWNSVAGATSYKVYRSTTGIFGDTPFATPSTESYTDTGLTAGTTYYYRISAVNGIGEGPLSPALSDTPPSAASAMLLTHNAWADGTIAAGGVHWYKFTAVASVSYRVQWNDGYNSGGGKTLYGYVSAYKSDGTPLFSGEVGGYTYPRTVSVPAGDTVYVRVEGQGEWSTGTYAIQYYDPSSVPPQTVPSDVRVMGTPAPACVVTWLSVSGATSYKVYRSAGGAYTEVGTPAATEYIDTGVSAGNRYYYRVAAVNANGTGPQSPAVSDTPPASVALLTHNTWADGTIAAVGEVHWYKFTALADVSYHVQWNDWYNSGGGKTLPVYVSAYKSDGTLLFWDAIAGYTSPRTVSVTPGDTIYVRVEVQGNNIGTYAIRYY
jgi:fibronectin type 3 domain-containing protein